MSHRNTITHCLLLLLGSLSALSVNAETLIHNINGYTITSQGLQQFSGLVIDDNGRVKQTLDNASLRREFLSLCTQSQR